MIRRLLLTLVCLLLIPVSGSAQKADVDKQARFDQLLARVKASDTTVDFTVCRFLFAELDSYRTLVLGPRRSQNYESFVEDPIGTMDRAKSVLAENYFDVAAHAALAMGAEIFHEDARPHVFVIKGVVDSIMRSGDGASPATAYKVITYAEEQVPLRKLDLPWKSKQTQLIDGHAYDVHTVVDPVSKEERKVYFNIDPIWRVTSRPSTEAPN